MHRLEIEGFGPFLDRQVVDFDTFDDDGIFLIAGRTGAGKSSVLDGVGFALYGGVPRYDGGAKRLRSDHCGPEDRTEVRLEFTVAQTRWRVTRSPEYERVKKNGTGTTTEDHRALVEELVDGEWVARAAKPREAAELLGEILGLNREQFQQVILLAQNRFAQFLLARNDERQALLRTLFGSRRYQDYEAALEQRRKDAEAAVADRLRAVETVLDEAAHLAADHGFTGEGESGGGVADRLTLLDRCLERGGYRLEVLTAARTDAFTARDAAVSAHHALQRLHERIADRDAARRALADLEARSEEVVAARRTLREARRAEGLRAPLEAADAALADVTRHTAREVEARSAWTLVGGEATDDAALGDIIDELTGGLAVWQTALAHEQAHAELQATLTAFERSAAAALARIDALETERAALPSRRTALDDALRAQTEIAATAVDVRRVVDESAARLAAAEDARSRADALHAAEKHRLSAEEEAQAASATYTALLRRRVEERAGELSAALVDGAPCAVCGATEHPHPAPRADTPVTDAELDAAEATRDAAQRRARDAGTDVAAARTAHADAAGRAAGMDVDAARRAHDDAVQRRDIVDEAVRARDALELDRTRLGEDDARTAGELAGLRTELAAAQEEIAALTERVAAAAAAVTDARGDFPSVADRIADGIHRRTIAAALRDAVGVRTAAETSAHAAETDRDRRIAASEFPDAAATREALRDAAERDRLDGVVTEHDTALGMQRARLMDLEIELAGAADPPPPLADSAAALADAREQADAAATAVASAEQAVGALTNLITRARDAHAAIAELEREHRLIAGVAHAVAGRNDRKMDLETFVLAGELEQIVDAANLRLDEMSSGRYRLRHTDALAARNSASGLGLEVVDAFTGQARPAQSLSGGETFLASLALALGLAEVVTARAGGIRLDTLFVDEGFGSLDPETLELAMRTLDELRQGGRTVGVISHVEAMKEQLPAQLIVEAAAHGPSTVRQGVLDPA
nr:SMC family ATPase [Microbacterium sp. SYP-A9085]